MRQPLVSRSEIFVKSFLSDTVREQCPDIPWQDIVGMRNMLTHEYFGISLRRVWMTVVNDVPGLKTCVVRILEGLEEP